uniref:Uncharacterized protein n=1 Tax=Nelumbo nucifera TaxID=4432 RepID=A0A822YUN0_NELNU|nr:TPA_asm: hypothetical protein HUJ06_005911 [Nelumbo nucifera]
MARLFCGFFFVLLALSVSSMVPSSDAKICQVVQSGYGCDFAKCRLWCFQVYNGKATCSAGSGFNPYGLHCVWIKITTGPSRSRFICLIIPFFKP